MCEKMKLTGVTTRLTAKGSAKIKQNAHLSFKAAHQLSREMASHPPKFKAVFDSAANEDSAYVWEEEISSFLSKGAIRVVPG